MGAQISTQEEINAPPHIVWEILMDFKSYPEWNPFVVSIRRDEADNKDLAVGDHLQVTIQPPGKKPMDFRPEILSLAADRELVWEGHLGCKGIFDGRHVFRLFEFGKGARTRLYHEEQFSGCLVVSLKCCLGPLVLNNSKKGFLALNKALKERAEARAAQAPANLR